MNLVESFPFTFVIMLQYVLREIFWYKIFLYTNFKLEYLAIYL